MITISFIAKNKSKIWKEGAIQVDNRINALRFIKKCKKDPSMFFIGFVCEYPDDTDYLLARI